MMNFRDIGRGQLHDWDNSKAKNFFEADINLQNVLQLYLDLDDNQREALRALGALSAGELDQNAQLEDRIGNHPRLERWSNLGDRIEEIEFHPLHDVSGKLIWDTGVLALQKERGQNVLQMAMIYLLAHNGEAGHVCSLACTSGLIRVLQEVGDAELQERFLAPLLETDYDKKEHGAQFLTEVQGGSDVGLNAVMAYEEDGHWFIKGEKWFCSNINADQFVVTARARDTDGTRGLGLFLVPRQLENGMINHFEIRRLKDKLGTRTLASAEVDFKGTLAYPIGAIQDGFKNTVQYVLNTSRLLNTVACAGLMRRAMIEAGAYACNRVAFGETIISYPMVQEGFARICANTYAATALFFYVAQLLDKTELGTANEREKQTYRILVNVAKYISSIQASESVHQAIEILGGNGAIESFSILPRLYRDVMVLESWEGTHNVLCLQVMRDIGRYQVQEGYFAEMQAMLEGIKHPDLSQQVLKLEVGLEQLEERLRQIMGRDEISMQAYARHWVHRLGLLSEAILLAKECQMELDQGMRSDKVAILDFFIKQYLDESYDPFEDENYLTRLQSISQLA